MYPIAHGRDHLLVTALRRQSTPTAPIPWPGLRRKLLERLQTPASATQLAAELTLGRQRVNYHLRSLEAAGLITLVEERQRRGCVERILAARAEACVVDPSVMGARTTAAVKTAAQDRFAAEHLIDSAAAVVRDVARMRARAQKQGTRLLVFTVDTKCRLQRRRISNTSARLLPSSLPAKRQSTTQPPADADIAWSSVGIQHHGRLAARDHEIHMKPSDRVIVDILVVAPIDVVWRALREPAEINRWFGWDYPQLAEETA